MFKKGYKQSPEHIKKRVEAIAKTKSEWTQERYNQWKERVSESNRAAEPEIREKNSSAHKGQIAWNKGNNWRNKYTLEEVRRINANRMKRHREQNVQVRISDNMGIMMRMAIKENKNGRHWEDFVDYTLVELIKHLEKLFQYGMSWNNYGKYGWHIDHIKPRSAFHFNNPHNVEFQECWSLENLQPLWAVDNLKKNAKF
jgi:hypothetical protein